MKFKIFKSHLFSQEVLGLPNTFLETILNQMSKQTAPFSLRNLDSELLGWFGKQIPNILPLMLFVDYLFWDQFQRLLHGSFVWALQSLSGEEGQLKNVNNINWIPLYNFF